MDNRSKTIITFIRDTIRKSDPTALVMLYGSRARGDFHDGSDWDVLVIVDTEKVTEKQFEEMNYNLWVAGLDQFNEQINVTIRTRTYWEDTRPNMFKINVKNDALIL
ncbi:MAG: nucleotidyltransferase domain-containing protein [Bacteroides sp.]|nr:nucleotidyltransferase domain-containing protein [Bacteroides sp.]MCM1458023.1 nucleotidyltransferase domain-containing protein [Lachnoclostridium sp.]